MKPSELTKAGCFRKGFPYSRCTSGLSKSDLRALTNARCLNIISDLIFNTQEPEFKWNKNATFAQLQAYFAAQLVQNELFIETLGKLDQLEIKKVAKNF